MLVKNGDYKLSTTNPRIAERGKTPRLKNTIALHPPCAAAFHCEKAFNQIWPQDRNGKRMKYRFVLLFHPFLAAVRDETLGLWFVTGQNLLQCLCLVLERAVSEAVCSSSCFLKWRGQTASLPVPPISSHAQLRTTTSTSSKGRNSPKRRQQTSV